MKRKLSVSDDHIYFARFHAHVHLHLISTSGLEQRETLWQVRFIKYQYSHKIERYECSVKVQVCLHQNLLQAKAKTCFKQTLSASKQTLSATNFVQSAF